MTDDIHHIRPIHEPLHERLLNWSRYVRFSGGSSTTPMFRHYRSYRGWHPVTPTMAVDTLDATKVEQEVAFLPEHHRDAIRWWYVYSEQGMGLYKACRAIGVQQNTLCKLVHDGRSMLNNRLSKPPTVVVQVAVLLRKPEFESSLY